MPVELNPPVARGAVPEAGKPGFILKGWHVLAMMVAFFGVIIAVNMTMMTLALRSMPGVEVKSPFEQSQKFNKGLEAIAAQDSKGWQVDVIAGGLKAGTPLSVQLRDKSGEAIRGMSVSARFQRPTDARLDQAVDLREQGNGVYGAQVPDLAAGQWRLVVEVKRGETREFLSQQRVIHKE